MYIFIIKIIRKEKNISLYKLSQNTGISRTYLRKLENNNECNPTFFIISKIAEALDTDIKSLFYEEIELNNLKEELYRRIEIYGINSNEALEVSQLIDLLINIKLKKE